MNTQTEKILKGIIALDFEKKHGKAITEDELEKEFQKAIRLHDTDVFEFLNVFGFIY